MVILLGAVDNNKSRQLCHRVIPFEGVSGDKIITASDVLSGAKAVGTSCVIVGGGLVGCEVALWLARMGKKVSIVEALPALMAAGAPVPTPNLLMMLDMLAGAGVTVYTGAKFNGYQDSKVTVTDSDGMHSIEADSVIQAIGFTPNNALYNELAENCPVPVWNIGDSKAPNNVMCAVRDGFFVGKNI